MISIILLALIFLYQGSNYLFDVMSQHVEEYAEIVNWPLIFLTAVWADVDQQSDQQGAPI